ncbi:hypothetical protein H671_3g11149 [Cricetulus griseus]|nr:hypothetical protein H671_3g11149 [Cricetulus griseus]
MCTSIRALITWMQLFVWYPPLVPRGYRCPNNWIDIWTRKMLRPETRCLSPSSLREGGGYVLRMVKQRRCELSWFLAAL